MPFSRERNFLLSAPQMEVPRQHCRGGIDHSVFSLTLMCHRQAMVQYRHSGDSRDQLHTSAGTRSSTQDPSLTRGMWGVSQHILCDHTEAKESPRTGMVPGMCCV